MQHIIVLQHYWEENGLGHLGSFPDITHTFAELSQVAGSVSEEQISQLERFVILLYDKTSECTHVNEARKVLFAKGGR